MISVVCWKWGTKYTSQHVNVLRAMVARNLTLPHTFSCITDDPGGLHTDVRIVVMPGHLETYPRQSRRLFIFADECRELIGERLLQIDLDMVIVSNIDRLVDRADDFVVWRSPSRGAHGYAYNPSLMLMTAGARAAVWDQFSAAHERVIQAAADAGWPTRADQSVISHLLGAAEDREKCWTRADGVYSLRDEMADAYSFLYPNTRIVGCYGGFDPATRRVRKICPWIAEYWRE